MTVPTPTHPGLPVRRTRTLGDVAAQLSDALADPPSPEHGGDRSPTSRRWLGQSLAGGAAGIAILHGRRAAAGLGHPGWAHAWLRAATAEELAAGGEVGLWFGAAAAAFAVDTAAPPGSYRRARAALHTAVNSLTRIRLDTAYARLAGGRRPALAEYDLVRGLTGLGAHLLAHDLGGALVREVLSYLVQLTRPVPADDAVGTEAPGWWTHDPPPGQRDEIARHGHANLGMAHGIAGPLALLALATRRGVVVAGQADAIDTICGWLDTWRQDTPKGPWWPQRVTLDDQHTRQPAQPGPGRPSWCYGTPGLARALQLAGHATGDRARQRSAEHALAACLSDPTQLARLIDPALCHGWAGVLLTTWHTATDADSDDLAAHLPHLIAALLRHAESRDLPQTAPPGLINGLAGLALTLDTVAGNVAPGWETCLLIA